MKVALIQARMGSSRFPGKVLEDLCGEPMLWHVVNRVRKATRVDRVVVATTDRETDDAVAHFCAERIIQCVRGDEQDVLDRFYQAAKANQADVIVRITADCPLIDPTVIDKILVRFERGDCDYVSNVFRYTYPDGLDTEVFSFAALERAWREARKPSEREHVTPYLRAGNFRTANVESEIPVSPAQYRWTVDHPADLEFVRKVYEAFSGNGDFGFKDVFELLKERPDLATIQVETISNEGYFKSLYQQAKAGAAPQLPLAQSQAWLERAKKVIPSCAQTFSKGYTQYVQGVAPIFLERGKGCRVWDVDGNEYIDYVQGLLPNILGYAHEEVNAAATCSVGRGSQFFSAASA